MKPTDLEMLSLRPHHLHRSVLSVYLNVDQSLQVNLNRGFETRLRERTARVLRAAETAKDRQNRAAAIRRMEGFLEAYKPHGKTLMVFCDVADGFFWHGEADFPVTNEVRWERELILQPLLNAADDLETYAVVLADRANVRLFQVFLGAITEIGHQKKLSAARTRHIKTVGTDHWGSASHVQRKADEQVKHNLRQVAAAAGRLVRVRKLGRLILAGTPEVTAELRGLLSTPVAGNVIGAVQLSIHATPAEVLASTFPLAQKHEGRTEQTMVSRVLNAAAKKEHAVVGLRDTLEAINSGRVWQLTYSGDFLAAGFECPGCVTLYAARKACPNCGGKLRRVRNVVEHAVEHALSKGARVEVVNGNVSRKLKSAGGIGALLKARTGTAHA
jgi:peptide subunit release factor 1 (eRF1)